MLQPTLQIEHLREKMQTAMKAAVADAVKAGTITQAQADALQTAGAKMGGGRLGRFGHGGGAGHRRGFGRGAVPGPDDGPATDGGPDDASFAPGQGFMGGDL